MHFLIALNSCSGSDVDLRNVYDFATSWLETSLPKSLKKYGDSSCSQEAYLEDEVGGKN